ncbi:uncharacterized protein B0J16DRAFT_316549 [Fusarium flagelliforme]|uniref:uncharacterized protein n=1 Tax=Fusarium flagelliforme TaxID=2675880 RepID=UPI001E8D0793|nr:uncharacterized protein B0J16DRAFT_316549 [Fusarium flagelliforme]KAH7192866.1 hypothetical protein B0J16DRAFT_316549 [Fusarium flagelliforme]
MDTSSFESFPDLPTELRLQIWGEACYEACREREASHPGIQYTTVRQSSSTRISLVHQPVHLDGKARSGTMRDGGLWLACKESRDVIREHCSNGPGGKGKVLAGDEWSYYVNPSHDIFCIQDPEKIKHDDVNSALHVSMWAVPKINDCCYIKNIALEFDPSWIKWFPRTYKNMSAESTPRGFLARLLRSQYINDNRQTTVWLIDNDMKRARRPSSYYGTAPMPDYNKRFINCHESYVEAYSSNTCHYCPDKRSKAIQTFLYRLNGRGEQCEDQHPNFAPTYDDLIDSAFDAPFEIAENVRVLALACNEIEFCRKDHRQDHSK